jgi:hypothetical protein
MALSFLMSAAASSNVYSLSHAPETVSRKQQTESKKLRVLPDVLMKFGIFIS